MNFDEGWNPDSQRDGHKTNIKSSIKQNQQDLLNKFYAFLSFQFQLGNEDLAITLTSYISDSFMAIVMDWRELCIIGLFGVGDENNNFILVYGVSKSMLHKMKAIYRGNAVTISTTAQQHQKSNSQFNFTLAKS